MRRSTAGFLALLPTLSYAGALFAQRNSFNNTAGAASGCFGCGFILALPIAFFVLNIALLVWVFKDAKSRGMENAVVWMILVLFTSFVGLIIYLNARPKGILTLCPSCREKRLPNGRPCPHCQAA